MHSRAPAILDGLASLADLTRTRLLLLLDRHELTVSEVCAIMQLPQSTISRHLKALGDAGWVTGRSEGTSNLYVMATDELDTAAKRLWLLVRGEVGSTPGAVEDARRLQSTLAGRRTKSQEFFSTSAGQWDRLRDELFGERFHLSALAALASADSVIGDLGCGTGRVSAALAPFVRRVIAVDSSAAMIGEARKRLEGHDNIDFRTGELEALPVEDGGLDAATMMMVLHHVPEPRKALAEVARVLKPGGRILLVDMLPHDRENYRQQMGHVWLGFPADQTRRMLTDTGFEDIRLVPLPPDGKAKGPGLFVASARKTVALPSAETRHLTEKHASTEREGVRSQ